MSSDTIETAVELEEARLRAALLEADKPHRAAAAAADTEQDISASESAAAAVAKLADMGSLDAATTAAACLQRISDMALGSARAARSRAGSGVEGVLLRLLREQGRAQPALAVALLSTIADLCAAPRCREQMLRAGAILVAVKVRVHLRRSAPALHGRILWSRRRSGPTRASCRS